MVALGQVFPEYFGFPFQFFPSDFFTFIIIRGQILADCVQWTQSPPHPKNISVVLVSIRSLKYF
jgi:hypothetical protein